MELFNHMAGIRMNHVPYRGGGPAMVELIAGHVQVFVQSVVQGAPPIKDGRVRALAVLGTKRTQILPEVPVMAETLPGYEAGNWYGLVVPAKTPAAVQKRIHGEIVKVLRTPDIENRIVAQGAQPLTSTPPEFAAFVQSESAKWARIIKSANIRAE
jgi:tripartite-type tricarboxylate transporter receptor subunit TctC